MRGLKLQNESLLSAQASHILCLSLCGKVDLLQVCSGSLEGTRVAAIRLVNLLGILSPREITQRLGLYAL